MPLFKIKTRHLKDYSVPTEKFSNTAVVAFAQTLTPKVRLANVANSAFTILDDTAVNVGGGYIVVTGSEFQSGAQVLVGNTPATSTSFVNSTILRAEVPARPAGTYNLFVVNLDGGTSIRVNGITYSLAPYWDTGTSLGNTPGGYSISFSVSATSDSNITYANTTTLPAGTILTNNTISGEMPLVENNSTYSVTMRATDVELQDTTSRTFTIDVTPRYQLWGWGDGGEGFIDGVQSATVLPKIVRNPPVWFGGAVKNTFNSYPGVAMVKYDGTLWAWGINYNGQLGTGGSQGTTTGPSSPVQIGSATNWNADKISSGNLHTLAIRNDGTLWAWGATSSGQIGTGVRNLDQATPVQLGSDTWSECAASGGVSCAIKTDGTLWAWGGNLTGSLGINNVISRSSPVQVGTNTNWSKVATGSNAVLAIKTDGTLWAWGNPLDGNGILGLNDLVYRSSPTQVGSDTNWRDVNMTGGVSSNGFVAALKNDNTLWTWGSGSFGQLGTNNRFTAGRSSPVQVGTGTDWRVVSLGSAHVLAIKTNGTLWAWGRNANGPLGDSGGNRSSPIQIGSATNWYKVFGGFNTSFAIARN